jgi:transcriptional regulator with XRE-family HTH domain
MHCQIACYQPLESQSGTSVDGHVINSIDPVVLGERLADARRARQLTQQQTADELGVARTAITAMENGERRPQAVELVKLARLYGRSVGVFVRAEATLTILPPEQQTPKLLLRYEVLAVRAYEAGLLSEGQLAERLGTDRIGARERVQANTSEAQPDEEGG